MSQEPKKSDCPPPEALRRFYEALPDIDDIKAHLDICDKDCNRFIEELSTDSLVEIMREQGDRGREPVPAVPAKSPAAEEGGSDYAESSELKTVSKYTLIK